MPKYFSVIFVSFTDKKSRLEYVPNGCYDKDIYFYSCVSGFSTGKVGSCTSEFVLVAASASLTIAEVDVSSAVPCFIKATEIIHKKSKT